MGPKRATPVLFAVLSALLFGCVGNPDKRTLAELRDVEPELDEVQVADGLDQAMQGYRKFLEQAPESSLTPEAMRRLADLKLEKEYGILGGGDAMPAPRAAAAPRATGSSAPAAPATPGESDRAFEARAAAGDEVWVSAEEGLALPSGEAESDPDAGPREAIELYDRILAQYPNYAHNDRVLYQKARAYDELGLPDEAIAVTERLIAQFPNSRHIDEVQFRRAEYFFTRRRYLDAEDAYGAIVARGAGTGFYELALYKLGWTLYKQELHEEALNQYVALLDHKVSTGYDFDQSEDQDAGRRIADTFRVVSLSFSSIGGPDAVTEYFGEKGQRPYEDRVYRHLGEFYFEKLRYQDAASAYEAFVGLYPQHRSSPHFGMRVVAIYEAGGFPQLVLSSKKDFAARYAFGAAYWQHHPVEEADDIIAFLKDNLRDLANHYHAAFQDPEKSDEAEASFAEATQWYRKFLSSFREDADAPVIHYQLADLYLEHEDFGDAAVEYESTAYDYPAHEKASSAGYAAIFAHRQHQEAAPEEQRDGVREAAVKSTLRFVDAFPAHEHAAVVLGAAVDDLFEMQRYPDAIATGRRLLAAYPEADAVILRSAWLAIAHSAFGIEDYPQAEQAYAQVLEMMEPEDETRQDVIDNLAASIYKQGEIASAAEEHRAAADHFLRIARVAPQSTIRPVAEFDAGAALIRLEDWSAAVTVLSDFREAHPEHELHREATKQLAQVYQKQGELERAAVEYERIAAEAESEELRREALLVAGELYVDAEVPARAIAVYAGYVERYPEPLEVNVETRFKMAELYQAQGETKLQRKQLRFIVDADRSAGAARSDRIRYLAARSSLVLTEGLYEVFAQVQLTQPFDKSLAEKKRRMNTALTGFGDLVDYEVGEVTAAATFYMAEIYRNFSVALVESERPQGLSKSEMLDYQDVLEEEAFPFEEKALDVHQKNLELMDAGVYNTWTEKSLAALAELMPGRFAKFEESSGWLRSVDTYVYQAPQAPLPVPTDDAGAPATAAASAEVVPAEVTVERPEVAVREEAAPSAPSPASPEVVAEQVPAAPAAPEAEAPAMQESASEADAVEAVPAAPAASEAPDAEAAPAAPAPAMPNAEEEG